TCPMTDRLEYDIKSVLSSMVRVVCINWVWMPPWSLELITEDGREQLRAIGFAI
ncbi:MAG: metal-sulfur cluster assembly factor, partial [Propionibacteriaceae bacterium]